MKVAIQGAYNALEPGKQAPSYLAEVQRRVNRRFDLRVTFNRPRDDAGETLTCSLRQTGVAEVHG